MAAPPSAGGLLRSSMSTVSSGRPAVSAATRSLLLRPCSLRDAQRIRGSEPSRSYTVAPGLGEDQPQAVILRTDRRAGQLAVPSPEDGLAVETGEPHLDAKASTAGEVLPQHGHPVRSRGETAEQPLSGHRSVGRVDGNVQH